MILQYIIALIALLAVTSLVGATLRDRQFALLLFAYTMVLWIASIVCVQASIAGGSADYPDLMGSDGSGYFDQAAALAQQGLQNYDSVVQSNYVGYQILLAVVFKLFGTNLLAAVTLNNAMLLLSVACVYRATILLTDSPRAAFLASLAMMLTPSGIYYSVLLLKEPALLLAFSLIMLASILLADNHRQNGRAFFYLFVALAVIVTMRSSLLLFLLVLIGFFATYVIRQRGYSLLLVLGSSILLIPLAQGFSNFSLDENYFTQTVLSNDVISSRFSEGFLDLSGVAGVIVGGYLEQPFVVKAVLFIIPTIVQAFMPFDFWSDLFLTEHPASFFNRNLNPVWFMYLVVWVGFAIVHIREFPLRLAKRIFLAGLFYYVVIAVIYGGLIPRYAATAIVFFYPTIGYWWDRTRSDALARAKARDFFLTFYVLTFLGALLFVAFRMLR